MTVRAKNWRVVVRGGVVSLEAAWAMLFVMAALPAQAQPTAPCTAIHVRGPVWIGRGAAPVEPRSTLHPADTLRFASAAGRVLALCPGAGQVLVRPRRGALRATSSTASGGEGHAWLAVVHQSLTEPPERRRLSTRGELSNPVATLKSFADVRGHFGVRSYLALGGVAVPVAATGEVSEALAQGGAFSFRAAGDASVLLTFQDGHLRAPAGALRTALPGDGSGEAPATLHFVAADGGERLLARTRLAVPSAKRVQRELAALAEALAYAGDDTLLREEAVAFLRAAYGVPSLLQVDALLARIQSRP